MVLLNHKRVFIRTIISTIIFWIAFGVVGSLLGFWTVYCKVGGYCPSPIEEYLYMYWIVLPIIFLISLGVNYVIEYFISRSH